MCHGPVSVICQRGNAVYVHCNGEVRAIVMESRAKLCELREKDFEKKEEQKKEEDENKWNIWIEEDENKEIEKDNEIKEDEMVMAEDGLKDVIGAKYLRMDKSVCFLENSIYAEKF